MGVDDQRIAVVGGTGKLGFALASRWAAAGLRIAIGSRRLEAAQQAAERIGAGFGLNREVAEEADIIVVTVPWGAQLETLLEIAPAVPGKLVVDTTVPLVPPKVARVQLPQELSAAIRARSVLPGDAQLISGFHNVSAVKLAKGGDPECDALIFGDSRDMRETGIALAAKAGLRGIHGGPLDNSVAAEALTSVLIHINKAYGISDGAGLRITGGLGSEG